MSQIGFAGKEQTFGGGVGTFVGKGVGREVGAGVDEGELGEDDASVLDQIKSLLWPQPVSRVQSASSS